MGLTSGQETSLQAVASTTACLSILGSSTIIFALLLRKRNSGLQRLPTTDRLVLVMSALDILASFFFAFGELPHEVSDGFCTFQGFGVQTFGLGE